MRTGNTTITGNTLGVSAVGGAQVLTYGNNRLVLNPTVGAAKVIGMWMCTNEVVELLNVVALQRFQHDFPLARISSINEDRLASGRNNKNRVTIARSYIQYVNLKLPT